jgi:hypothetical protein
LVSGPNILIFFVWVCFVVLFDNYFLSSSCRALSLTRGLVCNLQCNHSHRLEWRRTHNHTLLSHLRFPKPIPQEQGGQVIPPGTGFPFHCLLRLAWQRGRYSNPPPHGDLSLLSCTALSSNNGSLYTWTVVWLTVGKFRLLIIPVSGFPFSNIANIYVSKVS